MSIKSEVSHAIAAKAAKQLVSEGLAAGLDWRDILVMCETVITICVSASAKMNKTKYPVRYASEIIDDMTLSALARTAEHMKKEGFKDG